MQNIAITNPQHLAGTQNMMMNNSCVDVLHKKYA